MRVSLAGEATLSQLSQSQLQPSLQRVLIRESPFPFFGARQGAVPWAVIADWPARWLELPSGAEFVAYRLNVQLDRPLVARIHVTADERYELYVDGELGARGSERGDASNWFYESYDLRLSPGSHVLVARVWAISAAAPWAQVSVRPGFLLVAEEGAHDLLTTGTANWQCLPLNGISWKSGSEDAGSSLGGGPGFQCDIAALPDGWERGRGEGWQGALSGELPADADYSNYVRPRRHYLRPGQLPSPIRTPISGLSVRHAAYEDVIAGLTTSVGQSDDALLHAFEGLLAGRGLKINPGQTIRAVLDMGNYYCYYARIALKAGAGAVVRLRYAESLWPRATEHSLVNRGEVSGRYFRGLADEIRCDRSDRDLMIPWWRAGRFVQVEIRTAADPLELRSLSFEETRFPMADHFEIDCNIPHVNQIARVAVRTLQMCSHETHMDCPYYEQLQYVGDTRLQVLLGFLVEQDASLARKALEMFDASRQNPTFLTTDAYPGEGKLIPPFSLWWVAMICDYSIWRGDDGLTAKLLSGARQVMDRFCLMLDKDDLLVSPRGWNYVDSTDGFEVGVPPGGRQGERSGVLQWQMIYSLSCLIELEHHRAGSGGLEEHWRDIRDRMVESAERVYWDKSRELYADDLEHTRFSQHAQVLAILSDTLEAGRAAGLAARVVSQSQSGLTRCNIYFAHYLFEAVSRYDRGEYLRSRLKDWKALIDLDYRTFPEHFGATRSECHAWSSHVLYHILTTIAGVRYFAARHELHVQPALKPGEVIRTTLATADGMVRLDLRNENGRLKGSIRSPAGLKVRGPINDVVVS